MTERRLLTVQQAAARAGVSSKTIRRAYQRPADHPDRLQAHRPRGTTKVVIFEDELDRWAFDPIAAPPPVAHASNVATLAPSRRRDEPGSLARLREIEARRRA